MKGSSIKTYLGFVCGMLSMTGLVAPHCLAQSYLSNRMTFATGMGPVAAAAGDFNGDGKVDLAVVNKADNTVSILLAKPDSTFAPKVDYAVGTAPFAIVAADFNGDGKVDLAVLNSTSNDVSILQGKGDGTFAAQTTVPVDGGPIGIVTSDFNGDGKMDLAVASTSANAVDILRGNGDGTFTNLAPVPVSAPFVLSSGDFNGDGKLDLVTVNTGQVASVLLSKGDGTFTQVETSFVLESPPPTIAMAVGDFDGDGKVDLFVQILDQWEMLKGLGNGHFQVANPIILMPPGPYTFGLQYVVADFNHDGLDDFASSNTIMLGAAVGIGFEAVPLAGEQIVPLLSADINGDGVPDLIYVDDNAGSTGLVLLGNGDGTFGETPNYTLTGLPTSLSNNSATTAITADFNGDGKPDVAVFGYNLGVGSVAVAEGNGDGTFKPAVSSPIPYVGNASPAAADFNGDGKLDLATWSTLVGQTTTTQYISIYPGNGDGTFQTSYQVPVPANAAAPTFAAGDFNGDHAPDLAIFTETTAAGPAYEYVQILLNIGGQSFSLGSVITLPFAAGSNVNIAAADLNHDGKLDLAVVDTDMLVVLLGNGDGTFQNPQTYNCGGQGNCIQSFAVGDFNGDGKLDVVGAGIQGLSVFLGNGDGTFQPNILTMSSLQGESGLSVGDFNHDGNLDVAFWNGVALGNGDGTFQPPIYNGYFPAATLVGDFNSDGVPDVILEAQAAGDVPFLNGLLSAPQISLSPALLNFPPVEVGATGAPQNVTITNIGNAPLKISSVAAGGGYMATSACGGSIAAGAHCALSIAFTPSATGNQPGTLTIVDNLESSPQHIALNGAGVAPSVSLSPGSETFAAQAVGAASSAQIVTLSNTGIIALTLSSIATDGDFAQTNNCGSSLAAATSCKINVTFKPTANGSRTGQLTVTDNSPTSPQTTTLNGSGPDFTLAPDSGASMTSTVSAGQTATYNLNVTGLAGFSQSVSLTCTGAPSKATCAVSPTSPTAGSSPTGISVTVSTTAPSALAPRGRQFPPALPLSPRLWGFLALALVLTRFIWGVQQRSRPAKSGRPSVWVGLAAALLIFALGACGGGSGGGAPVPPTNPGTASGTYTLTVTGTAGSGSSALTHTVTLTLKVS